MSEAHSLTVTPAGVTAKQRIAVNFSKAAVTYDSAAAIQKIIAHRVLHTLPQSSSIGRVLDMGSGTGSHTEELAKRYQGAAVTGLDFAMGMLHEARKRRSDLSLCCGDIEMLPLRCESFDLIYSNLAIQWCSLDSVLEEVFRVLKPGGLFAFSTLGDSTFNELATAWKCVDDNSHINSFETFSQQLDRIERSYFQTQVFRREREIGYYANLGVLVRALRALGVNTLHTQPSGLLTPRRLRKLESAYERYRVIAGLPLTYQVFYGVLYKPNG